MGFPKMVRKVSRMMAQCILTKDQSAQTRVAPNSEAKFETEYHDKEDEEKTISDDDYSCDESDADDEVIVMMSGDDSETVSDVENEEQNIDDLSDEENNIVWEQACNLIENRKVCFFSNNYTYPLTVREGGFKF